MHIYIQYIFLEHLQTNKPTYIMYSYRDILQNTYIWLEGWMPPSSWNELEQESGGIHLLEYYPCQRTEINY